MPGAGTVDMPNERFEPLRERAFQFSVDVVRYCRCLPDTLEGRRVGDQLFRAGTAVGANYQAAGRGRSDREFIAKMGTVVEESDESVFWLRLLAVADIKRGKDSERLLGEARELLRIFSKSLSTAKENRKKRRAQRRQTGRQDAGQSER
jgi:four helix bundle protein